MQRILIRSGVNPYDKYSTSDYLARDLGGGNSGNLLYAAGIFRNIYGTDRVLDSNYYSLDVDQIEIINSKYSHFVIPLANAFRTDFKEITKLTDFIKKLKIPCVVTGVGGQFEYDPRFDQKYEFDQRAKEFCHAVLDKSNSIGVRGEITATYLKKSLNIPEDKIDVIGCPSIFYFGSRAPILKKQKEFYDSNITFHSSASVNKKTWDDLLALTRYAHKRFFIPQANYDLRTLYSGVPFKKLDISYPRTLSHTLHRHCRVRFFTRADSWINFYKQNIDYSVGIKIHGSIAAILGGSRALLIATDSRTRELAEFHHIPLVKEGSYKSIFELMEMLANENLLDQFYNSYSQKYLNFKHFMNKNGVTLLESNPNIANVNMIEGAEIGNVKSFLEVETDEKINRMTETYAQFQRKILKLKNFIS